MADWDKRFIIMADLVASWSQDPSTKCGAVIVGESNIVLAIGYNGFPRGVEYKEERWERPEKYQWIEHGERNAIYNAARAGISLQDATMYLNYAVECCSDCARAIIQSGITTVIGPKARLFPGVGKGKHYQAGQIGINHIMFEEANPRVHIINRDYSEKIKWFT